MKKAIILDLETTGFSRQWDYIIELAAICYDLDTNTKIDSFHEYIKPGKSIPAQVSKLTGITNNMVKNCRSEKEALYDFCEWCIVQNANIIIGHNCKAFDLGFIREKSNKYQAGWSEVGIEIIDTLTLARQLNKNGKIQTENCKQPTLAEYFGIDYEAHSAINDVEALILIYKAMLKLNNPPSRKDLGF